MSRSACATLVNGCSTAVLIPDAMYYTFAGEEAAVEPAAAAEEPAAVEDAPPAPEAAPEPAVEAPVEEAIAEAVAEAVAVAPEAPVVVETVTTTVETEEPAAPEVPQPTEGAVLTEAPAAPKEEQTTEQVCCSDSPPGPQERAIKLLAMPIKTCMQAGRGSRTLGGQQISRASDFAMPGDLPTHACAFGSGLLTRFSGMSEEAAYDAVAAQAAASAIAAKFAQQHAATEGDGPVDDLGLGKRKYEDDSLGAPLGDEHVRKRSNFSGPEGAYNGVSTGRCKSCYVIPCLLDTYFL